MPRRAKPPATLPPDILPADFLERHGLVERLILAPLNNLTCPRAWAPMTDAEWEAVAPYLWVHGCGMAPRARRGPAASWRIRVAGWMPSSAPSPSSARRVTATQQFR